jgi:hypothetical protein
MKESEDLMEEKKELIHKNLGKRNAILGNSAPLLGTKKSVVAKLPPPHPTPLKRLISKATA